MNNLPPKLTRKQVSELLGKSVRSVLRLDKMGALHPIRDARGNVTYARSEVEALLADRGLTPQASQLPARARLSEGDLTAAVFGALQTGKRLIDVTIEFGLTPTVAEKLAADFARISGAIVISGSLLDKLGRFLRLPKTAESLLDDIEYLVRRERELAKFVSPCAVCGKPVQARSSVEWAFVMECKAFPNLKHDECNDDK